MTGAETIVLGLAAIGVGVGVLVLLAEAQDWRDDGVHGDQPHLPEGVKAAMHRPSGEAGQVTQRPSVTSIQTQQTALRTREGSS